MPESRPPAAPEPPSPSTNRKPLGFLRIVLAVFWSFFGVRKGRHLLDDAASIKPQHLIVAGLLGGLFMVVSLLLFVRLIIKSTGA